MSSKELKPFFSIICATYNCAGTLTRFLDSVVSQEYKNFECWLIDGKSTDDTLEIIKAYAAQYNRIKWISEEDQGIYDALNKGINLSKGEWLYFIGADDSLFDAQVLNHVYLSIKSYGGDYVYGKIMNSRNTVHGQSLTPTDFFLGKGMGHQETFYLRKIFTVLGNYDLNYPVLADRVFNIKLFLDPSFKGQFIDVIVARYSNQGMSSNTPDPNFKSFFLKNCDRLFGDMVERRIIINEKNKILLHESILKMRENDMLRGFFLSVYYSFKSGNLTNLKHVFYWFKETLISKKKTKVFIGHK